MVRITQITTVLLLVTTMISHVSAFTAHLHLSSLSGMQVSAPAMTKTTARLTNHILSAVSIYDEPVECFLVEDDSDDNSAPPRVVCTSQPDEYAWFHGIDRDHLIPTRTIDEKDAAAASLLDNHENAALECVQEESPRGIPEWECVGQQQQQTSSSSSWKP